MSGLFIFFAGVASSMAIDASARIVKRMFNQAQERRAFRRFRDARREMWARQRPIDHYKLIEPVLVPGKPFYVPMVKTDLGKIDELEAYPESTNPEAKAERRVHAHAMCRFHYCPTERLCQADSVSGCLIHDRDVRGVKPALDPNEKTNDPPRI